MLSDQVYISNISTHFSNLILHNSIRWIYCNAVVLNLQNTTKLYDYVPQQWHYQGDMQSELANTQPTLMINLLSNYL